MDKTATTVPRDASEQAREIEEAGGFSAAAPPAANQYGEVAAVYDRLMAGVPHGAWLSRIERAVRARGKAPRSALDIACGTGIGTEFLARRGYFPVWGVDIAPAMIAIARTKSHASPYEAVRNIEWDVQNAARLDLQGRTFDLAVSLFDSLNYILDPSDLRRAFRRIAHHVAPNGVFAFDMNSMYALAHDLFSQTGVDGPVRHAWQAHWDRETRICRVEMDFYIHDETAPNQTRHFHETHVQRAYAVGEIKEWLEEAGFVRIEAFGNYGERAPGPKSDRLLFVAERA